MSKTTHLQRPLFGPWLAWEQLPDSVREQALDVLTAIYLEITDVSRIDEQTTHDLLADDDTGHRSQRSPQNGVRIR